MPVSINQVQNVGSPLDKIAQAVQIARGIQGINTDSEALDRARAEQEQKTQAAKNAQVEFQQKQDALARRMAPDSAESKLARAESKSYLETLQNSEIGKKNPEAFSPLLALANDPTVSAETLKTAFENSPLQKYVTSMANKEQGAALAGAIWGNRKDMQQDRMDTAAHQKNIANLKRDPQLLKRIGSYQNLENAMSNVVNADSLTPQQIEEFQQVVRGSLGIGAGGVGERERAYIHSWGMNAANIGQMISGDPASMAKDSNLIAHFKNLAKIEQKNISGQMDKRINAVTSGNGSMYERRPDLKQDLMDAITAAKDQYSGSDQQAGQAPAQPTQKPAWAK